MFGHRRRIDAFTAGPFEVRSGPEHFNKWFDPGVGQLHPLDIGVGIKHWWKKIGPSWLGPNQGIGDIRADHLSTACFYSFDERPPSPAFGFDRDF